MNQKLKAQSRQELLANPALQGLEPFESAYTHTRYLQDLGQKYSRKIVDTLQDAVQRVGLKDGMTISFHHGYREGDRTINLVVQMLADMGFKNLTLAASSLMSCNTPLIEHIKNGVIRRIYTSGMRGKLAEAISNGLMEEPVHIHSHGGRAHLIQTGEIAIDVAFLGVSACDEFGNANGVNGKSRCGSLGYAKVDAHFARNVIMLTEEFLPFPNTPVSISQDQVDFIVKVAQVGDPSKISVGAARATSDPRELLIARYAADVIEHSGYFKDGFSLQTGTGASSTAATRFMEHRMRKAGIKAAFALGGISGGMVDLHKKGLIDTLIDTQSFDADATESLRTSPKHIEVSTNEYANPSSKGTFCDRVDVVILSALEIDVDFNVNVLTGSDGVMRGASGGHSDVAAAANLSIVVGPLIRSRIPTVVKHVTTLVTPGECIGVLVTDHGIAVNPNRPEVEQRLRDAGLPVLSIGQLYERALEISGQPSPIDFLDKVVGVVRYRDGTVIDLVHQIKPLD